MQAQCRSHSQHLAPPRLAGRARRTASTHLIRLINTGDLQVNPRREPRRRDPKIAGRDHLNDAKEREQNKIERSAGTGVPQHGERDRIAPEDIIGYDLGMSGKSRKRATESYRRRLTECGMVRFEVLGLDADRELIRSSARRLAEDESEAAEIRATIRRSIAGKAPRKGGILAALRRSPLVGADLDLARSREAGRKIDF
jgi:hypothetical protein